MRTWMLLVALLVGCRGVETKAEVQYTQKQDFTLEGTKVTISVSRKW